MMGWALGAVVVVVVVWLWKSGKLSEWMGGEEE